jgi:hypothetical protein
MKIRAGFVSNSSSSSFLLKFPLGISKTEEFQKVLFGEQEKFMGLYDGPFETKEIAGFLWRKTYANYDGIASPGAVFNFFLEQERGEYDYAKWDENEDLFFDNAYKKMREFIKGSDDNIFIFEVEDHDAMGSEVEHDERIFKNIEYHRNNHH